MAVSPISFNGMIQRANDVSAMKQNEDAKPGLEQQSIQSKQVKQEHELTHKVLQANQKENERKRYDAKEKGTGAYQKREQKKKHSDNKSMEDKVAVKGQSSGGFDIKI